MRDYYAAFIEKKSEYLLETKVSKVSKVQSEGEKDTFDTFDTEYSSVNQKNLISIKEGNKLPEASESKNDNLSLLETTWFDLCAACKGVLYESRGQWFCPTNCR